MCYFIIYSTNDSFQNLEDGFHDDNHHLHEDDNGPPSDLFVDSSEYNTVVAGDYQETGKILPLPASTLLSSSSTAPLLSKDTSKDLTGLPTDEFPGILAKIQSEGRVKTLTRDISKAELKEIYDFTGFTFKKIDKYFGNIAGNALFGAKF